MALKQDIVVVNEYTVRDRGTGEASRGGTPGEYVNRYMARPMATEPITPIKYRPIDDFVLRYMARETATERAQTRKELKKMMAQAQGLGGVAFGYGSVSLSDAEVRLASKDLQYQFDTKGATVLKTVLSFSEDYLRRTGIIEPDFECKAKGDYRGNIDQMKLRYAIMHGLERMGHEYDDLRYVGVIQVDTEHVHCHLAMVDAGVGRLAPDGTQRGKINERCKSLLRRGIDSYLDEKQTVKHLSSSVTMEKRNVATFVKKWAYKEVMRESNVQFLLACLPEDRRMWRASTNRKEMRKANQVVREMVNEVLARPNSPMPQAMEAIVTYASERQARENLSRREWQRLVDNGREAIITSCIGSVYTMLRKLPKDMTTVRTPMLDLMSMDYDDLARAAKTKNPEPDPLVDFGFRLRSYSTRLQHHREERTAYRDQQKQWHAADEAGRASEESRVLADFYEFEEEYHAKLSSKYQKFLPFTEDDGLLDAEWDRIATYAERLLSLQLMMRDENLRRARDRDEAEIRGQMVYGHKGAKLLSTSQGRDVLRRRLDLMHERHTEMIDDLRVQLYRRGLALDVDPLPDDIYENDERELDMMVDMVDPSDTPEMEVEIGTNDVIDEPYVDPLDDFTPDMVPETDDFASETEPDITSTIPAAPADSPRRLMPVDKAIRNLKSYVPKPTTRPGTEFDFEEVKSLDLHHLHYDFADDVRLTPKVRNDFVSTARKRRELLEKVEDYLTSSGQEQALSTLPTKDVAVMNSLADTFVVQGDESVLTSEVARLFAERQAQAAARRSATVHLADGVAPDIEAELARTVPQVVSSWMAGDFVPDDRGFDNQPSVDEGQLS